MNNPNRPPIAAAAPAPWTLTGGGYIVAVKLPANILDNECFLDPALKVSRKGRLAYLMFVDYQTSPVGPYHELLLIPGSCKFNGQREFTISRILVSSMDSVVNGRINWGIPKEQCEFTADYGKNGIDRFTASLHGKTFASLSFRRKGFSLPVNVSLIPPGLRTLGQRLDGNTYLYTPKAKGRAQLARVLDMQFDPDIFPDLNRGKILAAFRINDFSMEFPVARISPAGH